MKPIYLIVGIPGSGKSWVCSQLKDKFTHIAHDDYMKNQEGYLRAAADATQGSKPVLIETPFSMSQIVEPLERKGFKVLPVFIIEDERTVSSRYEKRDGKPIPSGHLTRQHTYYCRAKDNGYFYGTSEDVLKHLRSV